MSRAPIFSSEPWALALIDDLHGQGSVAISGEGSCRAFSATEGVLNWSGGGGLSPRAGPSFAWKGQVFSAWHVPAGHLATSRRADFELIWRSPKDGTSGSLVQKSVLERPESSDTDSEAAKQGKFIDWLVHSFQELGQDELQEMDAAAGGLVRRDWKRAEEIWLNPDANEPRIELIIRMAQDRRLLDTLESISQSPRRILLRVRENTPVSRVQELDAACLRNYARLPGRDAIEKAGTRQELLSVQRRASHDTLENRITAWTINNLHLRSERWKRLHGVRARTGTRYRAVSKLSRAAITHLTSAFIAAARYSTLSHPVSANYPLMMDPRYKRVYRAYRELLRYEKIKDESWTWRRVLWSEGVTQLLSCTLRRLFSELYSSRPYYRSEPDRGKWLLSPASPGPFATTEGPLFVIDAHEADLRANGTLHPPDGSTDPVWSSIGVLGCDLILWWPDKKRFFPVWANLWTGSSGDWLKLLDNAARAIGVFSRHLQEVDSGSVISRGLIIGTSSPNAWLKAFRNIIKFNEHALAKTDSQVMEGLYEATLARLEWAIEHERPLIAQNCLEALLFSLKRRRYDDAFALPGSHIYERTSRLINTWDRSGRLRNKAKLNDVRDKFSRFLMTEGDLRDLATLLEDEEDGEADD